MGVRRTTPLSMAERTARISASGIANSMGYHGIRPTLASFSGGRERERSDRRGRLRERAAPVVACRLRESPKTLRTTIVDFVLGKRPLPPHPKAVARAVSKG